MDSMGARFRQAVADEKPLSIVGAINGAAVGIGATMTLPMDFRLASDKARVGFVFGRIGITPEACSTWSRNRALVRKCSGRGTGASIRAS